MQLIDTHSHLYDEAFESDLQDALARASDASVKRLLLPAIDSESHEALFALCRMAPTVCRPMMGLHPTSINDNPRWREELALVEKYLDNPPAGIRFVAVGEIGLDFYWSQNFMAEQTEAFVAQLRMAAMRDLPVAIHTRAAWEQIEELILRRDTLAVAKILEEMEELPEAFQCANDRNAFILNNALQYLGRKVPEDVAVVGFDDGDLAKIMFPPLTTLHISTEQMGSKSFQRLLWRLDHREVTPEKIVMNVGLRVRGSTKNK